jgi:NADH-quinone oxidoreductase subunit C
MQPNPLTIDDIAALVREKFGDVISDPEKTPTAEFFTITDLDYLQAVMYFLREDKRTKFNYLYCLSGVDNNDGTFTVVYHLESLGIHGHRLEVKANCSKEKPEIPSVSEIWRTADWHEREVYDLFGIKFIGHPDLRRILCPEDWEGHPLRKDYKVAEYYHGIRIPY